MTPEKHEKLQDQRLLQIGQSIAGKEFKLNEASRYYLTELISRFPRRAREAILENPGATTSPYAAARERATEALAHFDIVKKMLELCANTAEKVAMTQVELALNNFGEKELAPQYFRYHYDSWTAK